MVYSCWVCIQINIKLFSLLRSFHNKYNYFIIPFPIFRLAEEAAQACFEQRDLQSLYTVHNNATKNNDRALVAKVENYIEKLSEKR